MRYEDDGCDSCNCEYGPIETIYTWIAFILIVGTPIYLAEKAWEWLFG